MYNKEIMLIETFLMQPTAKVAPIIEQTAPNTPSSEKRMYVHVSSDNPDEYAYVEGYHMLTEEEARNISHELDLYDNGALHALLPIQALQELAIIHGIKIIHY